LLTAPRTTRSKQLTTGKKRTWTQQVSAAAEKWRDAVCPVHDVINKAGWRSLW